MSFIGKSIFSLSWLGQLFNDSVGPRNTGEHLHEANLKSGCENQSIDTAQEPSVECERKAESLNQVEEQSDPGEHLTSDEKQVSDDFIQHYHEFLKSKPSPLFWQRQFQRDDAAEDESYSSESSLPLSSFPDFVQSADLNEGSSFDESFERSSTSSGDLSFEDQQERDRYGGNQLIVMSGDDFGWSLSDAAEDPRRTGLANFRHNILIRPVPAPSIETLANMRDDPHKRSVHYKRHEQSQRYRSADVRSDYETGRGSASSSSFDEEGRIASDDYQPKRVYQSQQRELRHLFSPEATSGASRSGKPYRRTKTVSQCSDSCLGSDFPSLTSTGSSESEMIPVIERSIMKCSGPASGMFYAKHAEASETLETNASTMRWKNGTLSNTSSQTSIGSSDCWRGSIQHALTVMEHRGQEMNSLFDQLHEIGDDLALMDDQVGQVTRTLQQQQQQRDRPLLPSHSAAGSYQSLPNSKPERRGSVGSASGPIAGRRQVGSCLDLRSLNEDEMAAIVHRLLKRVCEHTLARHEGKLDVPLIV